MHRSAYLAHAGQGYTRLLLSRGMEKRYAHRDTETTAQLLPQAADPSTEVARWGTVIGVPGGTAFRVSYLENARRGPWG